MKCVAIASYFIALDVVEDNKVCFTVLLYHL